MFRSPRALRENGKKKVLTPTINLTENTTEKVLTRIKYHDQFWKKIYNFPKEGQTW